MPTAVSVSHQAEGQLLTAEEFLDWLQPGTHADLIDGKVFMHSPVNLRHADLLNFVDHLLRAYIARRRLGKLYREVVAVRLSSRQVYLPDLCFIPSTALAKLRPSYIAGAPALVVEALSPTSAERDLGPKFATYEEQGVQEYWVLDPQKLGHRFYRREGELLVEFARGAELIRSTVLSGFWMRRSWLDPATPPDVEPCLAEITQA